MLRRKCPFAYSNSMTATGGRGVTVMTKHILELIAATNPDCEIWWDSSPLVYGNWVCKTLAAAPAQKRDLWAQQLQDFFDPDAPQKTLVRGVTTNPPLCQQAIEDDPQRWSNYIRGLIEEYPDGSVEDIYWMTYQEIVRLGAEKLRPLWQQSHHRYGYLSAQVDPRFAYDYAAMLRQARELQAIAPNVMVKCPGTFEGYRVLEEMTAMGVATNNTSSFSVAQYIACMDAVSRGLQRARENGIDLFRWRSVITHMSDRLSQLGDLHRQAQARGIELSEEDIRWGEIAIFKRGYQLAGERRHPSKMLMCSMRAGSPKMRDGSIASWHIEKIAGADVVYTCPPSYIGQLLQAQDKMRPPRADAIDEALPRASMDKLMKIPYFLQSYQPDGMSPEQFNRHAPLVATIAEFSAATRTMVDFVARQFEAN